MFYEETIYAAIHYIDKFISVHAMKNLVIIYQVNMHEMFIPIQNVVVFSACKGIVIQYLIVSICSYIIDVSPTYLL